MKVNLLLIYLLFMIITCKNDKSLKPDSIENKKIVSKIYSQTKIQISNNDSIIYLKEDYVNDDYYFEIIYKIPTERFEVLFNDKLKEGWHREQNIISRFNYGETINDTNYYFCLDHNESTLTFEIIKE